MNLLSFASLFTAFFALFQGIVVLLLDRKSRVHQLFFAITICLFHWSLATAFGYTSANIDEIFFWLRLSTPGYTLLHAFTLHFVLEISGLYKPVKKIVLFLIYAPSLFFCYYGLTHVFVFKDFVKVGNLWLGIPMLDNPVFLLFMLQYLSYYVTSALLLFLRIKNSNSNRIKRQGALMFGSIILTVLIYNIEPFLLPLLTTYKTSVIAVNAGILWVTGFWIAIIRYRLFTWQGLDLFQKIFQSIEQPLLMLDEKLCIEKVNISAVELIGHSLEEILQNQSEEFLHINSDFETIRKSGETRILFGSIVDAKGESHSIRFKATPIFDRYRDFCGILLAGTEMIGFELLQKEYGLTDREMNVVRTVAGGINGKRTAEILDISLNTVKSHLTHIYNKTGTNNRMELLQLLAKYEQNKPLLPSIFS
jgi:DNA-binding CsgD family transcriptional regulator